MAIRKRNNITVICEGDTEYNYLTGLKIHINSKLNLIPTNANGGDYSKVLKKLKQTSAIGTVARFVLADFDRYVTIANEDKNFQKLLEYCRNEQKKGNPTFLVTSNPDFDIFVLKHNAKYKNQDKLTFLKDNYKYKTIEAFKHDEKIFERFNPNLNEYLNVSYSFNLNELIISNKYEFDSNKFTFRKMSIIFKEENSIYRLTNIFELFKIL